MATTSEPVHVYGEIGTEKIRISQAIHNSSSVADGPFVTVNCVARTPETLERELFGWEDGKHIYESLFEIAESGTLCIEEIGELPIDLQARLLQAVTEKKIIRMNGNGVIDINVRLITTSSCRLDKIPTSRFRPELLLVITQYICRVPSLSERMEDLEALVFDYLKNQLKKPNMNVSGKTIDILKMHKWEGNVQELYNVLQHTACMARDELRTTDLPYYIPKEITTRLAISLIPESSPEPQEKKFDSITRDLTTHGFLGESREILKIYKKGKEQNKFYGRTTVQSMLEANGFKFSKQQLRLKLERMDKHGLLIVRPGRGGTTISDMGESYLQVIS
jgi:DNA-binding NtrC family response regulator